VRVVSNADVTELQMALSALTSWADYWQLSVSVDKCGVLHIGKQVAPTTFTITCELSTSPNINDIVTKAHCRANMIHRCFISRNIMCFYHLRMPAA